MRSTHVERAILVRVYGIICRLQADNAATREARIWYEKPAAPVVPQGQRVCEASDECRAANQRVAQTESKGACYQ